MPFRASPEISESPAEKDPTDLVSVVNVVVSYATNTHPKSPATRPGD